MKFKKNYVRSPLQKGTVNTEPSMTQQEHEAELEINNVMARYVKTGYLPLKQIAPMYLDLSVGLDFDTLQDKVLKARELFIDLPIEVRDEFRTADELLKAFHDPKGQARLRRLGVLETKQEPTAPVAGSGVQPQVKAPEPGPAS